MLLYHRVDHLVVDLMLVSFLRGMMIPQLLPLWSRCENGGRFRWAESSDMMISEADALAAHKAIHEGKNEVKLENLGVYRSSRGILLFGRVMCVCVCAYNEPLLLL